MPGREAAVPCDLAPSGRKNRPPQAQSSGRAASQISCMDFMAGSEAGARTAEADRFRLSRELDLHDLVVIGIHLGVFRFLR